MGRAKTETERNTQRYSPHSGWLKAISRVGISLGVVLGVALPTQAANQIEFEIQPIGKFTVPVNELRTFAQEGKVSGRFGVYVKIAPAKQLEDLRQILQQRYEVSAVTVDQFTATRPGENMLQQLTQVLKPTAPQDPVKALRTGFVQAAKDSEGLTILNFLENYPDETVRIDLRQSFVVVRELLELFQTRDRVVAAIEKQASQSAQLLSKEAFAQLDLRPPGSLTWQQQTLTINNPQRKQTFPVDLYSPKLSGPSILARVPLIVISHGMASDRTTFAYLAEHLASYGFAVAVIEHPGTNAKEIEQFFAGFNRFRGAEDWLHRPLDVKYLLDELEQKTRTSQVRGPRLDLQRVGILGQSFGGYTALAAGGASLNLNTLRRACPRPNSNDISFNIVLLFQCEAVSLPNPVYTLRDRRIKAILAINPLASGILGRAGISQITVPTMIIGGSEDYVAPIVPEQILPFTWLTAKQKYLVLTKEGSHFSYLGGAESSVVQFPPDLVGPDPTLAQPMLKALGTAFFKVFLSNQTQYQPALEQSYAQQISQVPFNLSVLKSFTQEQFDQAIAEPAPSP
jgi:predicted dienelactone hydrolase